MNAKCVMMRSQWSGRFNYIWLDITDEQWQEWQDPKRKRFVQEIFPHLTPEQREFLLTGITPDEWKEAFDAGME